MPKSVQDCRDSILSALMAGVVDMAAQANARVTELEEVIRALEAQLAEYKKAEEVRPG